MIHEKILPADIIKPWTIEFDQIHSRKKYVMGENAFIFSLTFYDIFSLSFYRLPEVEKKPNRKLHIHILKWIVYPKHDNHFTEYVSI